MFPVHHDPFLLLLLVLVGLHVKHFLADFPLQSTYMLRKVHDRQWLVPLTAHCAVHGALTALLLLPFLGVSAILFGVFDFLIHGLIDYWKAQLTHYSIAQKGFWVTLGLDQMLHNLTYLAIVFIALRYQVIH